MYPKQIEPEFISGSVELDLPNKPYPGNLAEDAQAAMAPSLAGVFQQFNQVFGTGECPHKWVVRRSGFRGIGIDGQHYDSRQYQCERCGEVR